MIPSSFPLPMKTTGQLALLLVLSVRLGAQITIVDSGATGNQVNLGGTYSQNFDSLPSSTPHGGNDWVNNVTIPGWYSTQSAYFANVVDGGLGSYGTDGDRAFGSIAAIWSLRFVNSSNQTITGLTVSFDVEQWYRGANDPQIANNHVLFYRIYDASISEAVEVDSQFGAGWTYVPGATFTSPNVTLTSSEMLDGNLAENRGFVSVTVDDITLAPGQKLWLRWGTGEDPGEDHALATDNVSVSFQVIPEPAAAAALVGLAALACCARRRSRA